MHCWVFLKGIYIVFSEASAKFGNLKAMPFNYYPEISGAISVWVYRQRVTRVRLGRTKKNLILNRSYTRLQTAR